MEEPIRYSKEELRSLQWSSQVEGQWESMVETMDPCSLFQPLFNPITPTEHHHHRRNPKKRRRHQISNPPSSFHDAVQPLHNQIQPRHLYVDNDDDDDVASLQRPALLVEGEPDFESGPPQDGFEYLRRVIWETAQCPKVKIAKISKEKLESEQTNYMPEIPPIPTCSPCLLPTKEWVRAFLRDFSDLRSALVATSTGHEDGFEVLPHIRDKVMWKSRCFGGGRSHDYVFDEVQEEGNRVFTPLERAYDRVAGSPRLKILLRLNEVSRATLFRYHVSWFEELGNATYERAMWLFALSAVLDYPLDDETSAAFRVLLRKCAELRMKKSAQDEELFMLNILIAIAGAYFCQAESSSVINA